MNGYLTLEPDPSDGRARIIRLTDRGRRLHRAAVSEHAAIESGVEEEIGERRYEQVRSGLAELVRPESATPSQGEPSATRGHTLRQ